MEITRPEVRKLRYENHLSDSLRIEDAFLNGHPLKLTWEAFSQIENPDSSAETTWHCGCPLNYAIEGPLITTYWCNNREYFSDHENVQLQRFDMAGNEFSVPSKNLVFTEQTTIAEFRTFFPKSVLYEKQSKLPGKPGGEQDVTEFRVHFKTWFDACWVFTFNGDRLVSVRLWWLLC